MQSEDKRLVNNKIIPAFVGIKGLSLLYISLAIKPLSENFFIALGRTPYVSKNENINKSRSKTITIETADPIPISDIAKPC